MQYGETVTRVCRIALLTPAVLPECELELHVELGALRRYGPYKRRKAISLGR